MPSKKLPGIPISKYDSLELKQDGKGNNKELLWWHTAFEPMKILDPGDQCFADVSKYAFYKTYKGDRAFPLSKIVEEDFYEIKINPSIMCYLCARHVWIRADEISQLHPYKPNAQVKRLKEPPETSKLMQAVQKVWN